MSHLTPSVGSRIVEVVIKPRVSKAIALGKRKAAEAFASGSGSRIPTPDSSSHTSDADEVSDFEGLGEEDDDEDSEESGAEDCLSRVARPPGSETPIERRYRCTHQDCTKYYTKPSRLAEHQRSHTGERPYVCSSCSKSYLRESHLQAHARSHLHASERPLACTEDACTKRFWTTQHLSVHIASVHERQKVFSCVENGCDEHFAKHNQLRRHVADVHCPPGTKLYPCPAEGCNKSFSTNQKLRKHSKVHEGNRYACADPSCVTTTASGTSSSLYFSTWTALQAHIREDHPPTCPHPECEGRVFASHKGLKGHLKVHEERELEKALEHAVGEDERPNKRRRGGEVGRDWACTMEGCVKTFKSKKALTNHHNITHLGRRDHVCSRPGCGQTFGYKHLLQRHTAKAHPTAGPSAIPAPASSEDDEPRSSTIGWITGLNYTSPSSHHNTRRALLPCPWPDRFEFEDQEGKPEGDQTDIERCTYVFSRAYDLRRHLKADHGLELTKEEVDGWARDFRERRSDT